MKVELSADQEAAIQEAVRTAIASGRGRDEADAVRQALAEWAERERAREQILRALDQAEDGAEAEIAGVPNAGGEITEDSMRRLAEEVKQRGRSRLAKETAFRNS